MIKIIVAAFILLGGAVALATYFSSYVTEGLVSLNSSENKASMRSDDPWEVAFGGSELGVKLESPYVFDDGSILAVSRDKRITTFHDFTDKWEVASSFSDVYVKDIEFVSRTHGYLIGSKYKAPSNQAEDTSCLRATSDRARTWTTLFCKDGVLFTDILFNKDGNGVLVGTQSSSYSGSILITRDNGKIWQDVTDSYDRFATSVGMRVAGTGISNATFHGDDLYVFLNNRWLIKTADMGNSWNVVTVVWTNENTTGLQFFGLRPNATPWVAGKNVSIEGKWSEVATLNIRGGWDFYQLQMFRIEDIEFISNEAIIAAGAHVGLRNYGANPELDTGAILFSSNQGKEWSIVYQHEKPGAFISINQLSKDQVLAVGEDGMIVTINGRL